MLIAYVMLNLNIVEKDFRYSKEEAVKFIEDKGCFSRDKYDIYSLYMEDDFCLKMKCFVDGVYVVVIDNKGNPIYRNLFHYNNRLMIDSWVEFVNKKLY